MLCEPYVGENEPDLNDPDHFEVFYDIKDINTFITSGKGHLALAVFRCFSCPRTS